MAIKFSQFTVGSSTSDIDYLVGYKNTDNIQIPVGLVGTNTTYGISTAQSGSNETITLTGSDSSTDVITITAGSDISLTDDGAGNGFTIASTVVGDTYTIGTSTNGSSVDVNLDAAAGADSNITLTPVGGITITQAADVITIDSTAVNGTVTSVGTSTTALTALTLSGTVTTSGTLDLAKTGGAAGQYIDGATGAWTNLPASGVTSVDETTPGTSTGIPIVVNPTAGNVLVQSMAYAGGANIGHVPSGGSAGKYLDGAAGAWTTLPAGDIYTLQAGTKVGSSVPINLDAATGTDSVVSLTEGTGITLTQTSATEITIDGSAGTTVIKDQFTGNNSTTAFPLSVTPTAAANLNIFISGVYQNSVDSGGTANYTVSGTTLTFVTAPPTTATNGIEVVITQ